MTIITYKLTPQIIGRLKTMEKRRPDWSRKNPALQCMLCRKDLQVGDILTGSRGNNHTKRYHQDCAKKINYT